MDHLRKFEQYVTEVIKVPIKVGDTVLGGRFKNKKIVVKKIGKNPKGDITINGKPLLKFRIIKESLDDLNRPGKGDQSHITMIRNRRQQEIYHHCYDILQELRDMGLGVSCEIKLPRSQDRDLQKNFLFIHIDIWKSYVAGDPIKNGRVGQQSGNPLQWEPGIKWVNIQDVINHLKSYMDEEGFRCRITWANSNLNLVEPEEYYRLINVHDFQIDFIEKVSQ